MAERTTIHATVADQTGTGLKRTAGETELPEPTNLKDVSEDARQDGIKISADTDEQRRATGRYLVRCEGGVHIVDFRDEDEKEDDTPTCDCLDCVWDGKDCEHQRRVALEITYGDLAAPGEVALKVQIGDETWVNWSKGEGDETIVCGTVEEIIENDGQFIVAVVDENHREYENGKRYFAKPEWLTPVDG